MSDDPERSSHDRPFRLLLVCHANVARSVVAAYLLRDARDERGVVLQVATAGTHATLGQAVSPRTSIALGAVAGEEVDLTGHRSRPIEPEDLDWADLVLAMESRQVTMLRRAHHAASSRIATLAAVSRTLPKDDRPAAERVASLALESATFDPRDDVFDPAGGGDADYERTAAELVELCGELADRLAG